jgi:hypothetical protein
MKTPYGLALAVVGAGAWFFMTHNLEGRYFELGDDNGRELFLVAYGYVMTVAGVVLGSAYRALDRMRAAKVTEIANFPAFARDVFRSVDFWMALLASPIVYAALWKTIDSQEMTALTIFPLENGFACLAVISALMKKKK